MRILTLLLVLTLPVPAFGSSLRARQAQPSEDEYQAFRLAEQEHNLHHRILKLRRFLDAYPKSKLAADAQRLIVESLIVSDGATSEIVSGIDALIHIYPNYPRDWPGRLVKYAGHLVAREERLDDAKRFIQLALATYRGRLDGDLNSRFDYVETLRLIAEIDGLQGNVTEALAVLQHALPHTLNDKTLRSLTYEDIGRLEERRGNLDAAIEAYVCATQYAGATRHELNQALKDAFTRRHGSSEGLEVRLGRGCSEPRSQ